MVFNERIKVPLKISFPILLLISLFFHSVVANAEVKKREQCVFCVSSLCESALVVLQGGGRENELVAQGP